MAKKLFFLVLIVVGSIFFLSLEADANRAASHEGRKEKIGNHLIVDKNSSRRLESKNKQNVQGLVHRESAGHEENKETIADEKCKDKENDHYKDDECREDQECDNTEDDGSDGENDEDELNEDGDGKDDEAGDEEEGGHSFGKVFKRGPTAKGYVGPKLGDGGRAKRARVDYDPEHPAGG